jgi:hypothetical protein
MGLSAEEGASAPVVAAPTPNINMFAAAFGEFLLFLLLGRGKAVQGENKISSIHFYPLF